MLEKYKIAYEGGQGEIVEKKSRFIATIRPVKTCLLYTSPSPRD